MMILSTICAGGLHEPCTDWDGCACICHQTCPRCASRCRVLYSLGDDKICATCYKKEAPKGGSVCDACGARFAFRDPRVEDERYLCSSCHAEAGHPQGQVIGPDDPRGTFQRGKGTRERFWE